MDPKCFGWARSDFEGELNRLHRENIEARDACLKIQNALDEARKEVDELKKEKIWDEQRQQDLDTAIERIASLEEDLRLTETRKHDSLRENEYLKKRIEMLERDNEEPGEPNENSQKHIKTLIGRIDAEVAHTAKTSSGMRIVVSGAGQAIPHHGFGMHEDRPKADHHQSRASSSINTQSYIGIPERSSKKDGQTRESQSTRGPEASHNREKTNPVSNGMQERARLNTTPDAGLHGRISDLYDGLLHEHSGGRTPKRRIPGRGKAVPKVAVRRGTETRQEVMRRRTQEMLEEGESE